MQTVENFLSGRSSACNLVQMQSDGRWFVGDSAGNLLSMDPTAAVEVVVETVDAASTVLDPVEHDESDRAVQVMARRPGSTNEIAIAFRDSISITYLDDVSSTVHYFASCSFLSITHIEFHCDGDLL